VAQESVREDALLIPQGVDWAIAWPIVDSNGQSIDLSNGYTARAQARHRADEDVVLQEWSSATAGQIELTTEGQLVLNVPGVTSRTWTWDHAVYDVVLTGPGSATFIVSAGGIEVSETVTR
jgi:hypothetical protein